MRRRVETVDTSNTSDAVFTIDVVDIHVGGDVHRIVLDGVADLPGVSVLEQTRFLEREVDGLRRLLLEEPRGGHPALFADLVVRPSDARAEAGLIIMENNGYPMFSGTNIMSTAIALLESGRLPMVDGEREVVLEAPGGLVDVLANCKDGRVMSVTCETSKPVIAYSRDLHVEVPRLGQVTFDLFWAGEFFPVIDATAYGFAMASDEAYELGAFARDFVEAVRPRFHPRHPEVDDERPLASVVFMSPVERGAEGRAVRQVVPYVYPNRQVGRCPAGMPSSIAIAEPCLRGQMAVGDRLLTRSPAGSELEVQITGELRSGPYDGVKVAITGRGWTIARTTVIVDPSDPLTPKDGLERVLTRRLGTATGWAGSTPA